MSIKARAYTAGSNERYAERRRIALSVVAPCVLLACGAILWLLSLRGLDLGEIDDLGLISILPPEYFVALGLVTVSFGLSVNDRQAPGWLLFLHIVLLIAIIHGTPSLAYGTLRYSWAWKHVGMVDFIQRHGTVDLSLSDLARLSAYHNFPGFFALGALFTEAAGFTNALQLATLAPLFFNLINVGALLLMLGACTQDRRLKWLAVWFFFLANWIGQDYFSPQAMTYFLYLVIIGICLTWFSARPQLGGKLSDGWPVFGRLEPLWNRLSGPNWNTVHPDQNPTRLQRTGLLVMVIMLLGTVATSHQLTPFMVLASLVALAVTRRLSARGLPVLLAVIICTWMFYVAWSFVGGNLLWIVESIGNIGHNVAVTNLAHLSKDQVVVAVAARGLSALIAVLGIAGLGWGWHRGRRDLPYMLLAVAPFPILAASSYSGEMTFRVYLFALPYVAFFAAALFYPQPTSGRSWRIPIAVIAVSSVLLAGLLLAYYGRERMNYLTPNEVDAARYLYSRAPAGSLVIGVSYNYPSVFQNYESYTHLALTGRAATKNQLLKLRNDPLNAVNDVMSNQTYPASYLIITRGQKAHIEMDGVLPPGSMDSLEQRLRRSSHFQVIYENQDAVVFALAGQEGAAP